MKACRRAVAVVEPPPRRKQAAKAPRGYQRPERRRRPGLARWTLRLIALVYLTFLLLVPVGLVF